MSQARSNPRTKALPLAYQVRNIFPNYHSDVLQFEIINNCIVGVSIPNKKIFLLELQTNPLLYSEYDETSKNFSQKLYPLTQDKFACFKQNSICIFDVRVGHRNDITSILLPNLPGWTDNYSDSNFNYISKYNENILIAKNDKTIFSYAFNTNTWKLCYKVDKKCQLTHMESVNNKFLLFENNLDSGETNIILLNEHFKKEKEFKGLESKEVSLSPSQNKVMSPSGDYMALIYLDNTIKIYLTGNDYGPILIQTFNFHNYPAWLADNTLIYFEDRVLTRYVPAIKQSTPIKNLGDVNRKVAPLVTADKIICLNDLSLFEFPTQILENTKQSIKDTLISEEVGNLPKVLSDMVIDYLTADDLYTSAGSANYAPGLVPKNLPDEIRKVFQELYTKLDAEINNLQAELNENSLDKKNILRRLEAKFQLLQALQVLANKIENNSDKTLSIIIKEVKKYYPQAFQEKTYSIFKEKNPLIYLIDKIEKLKPSKKLKP